MGTPILHGSHPLVTPGICVFFKLFTRPLATWKKINEDVVEDMYFSWSQASVVELSSLYSLLVKCGKRELQI